jgi:hypothetical protein
MHGRDWDIMSRVSLAPTTLAVNCTGLLFLIIRLFIIIVYIFHCLVFNRGSPSIATSSWARPEVHRHHAQVWQMHDV